MPFKDFPDAVEHSVAEMSAEVHSIFMESSLQNRRISKSALQGMNGEGSNM